jgi:hypothetical protein
VEPETAVPRQAILLAMFSTIAVTVCGHNCAFATLVVLAVAAVVWLSLAAFYYARVKERRDPQRAKFDVRAAWSATLGFGIPAAAALAAWLIPDYRGLLTGDAAALAAVLVTIFFAALLASSMADWYYILPRALGLTDTPVWLEDGETPSVGTALNRNRRRGIAQLWIFHRGVCELLTLTAVALFLAVGLVALGKGLSSDETLRSAFDALGGAGVAVGVFGYLGPRLRHGLDFLLSTPVGLGTWVTGRDDQGRRVSGLVVDVSIVPGLKLVNQFGRRAFVPLSLAHRLQPVRRPYGVGSDECREIVETHLGRGLAATEETFDQRVLRWLRRDRHEDGTPRDD